MISAYIALRFEWKYAVPVLIALMHDLLITAGVYSLTGREVTTATVAALLTILGYSLYDTIIVFDRVRENVPRMPRAAFSQIVNRSMSEVLTRSLATSFCTLLPVLALLFFGGETLKDFAFALMVGIASGRVLLDLHRLAGADPLEGARARLPRPPRADRARNRLRARRTRPPPRGAPEDVEPEQKRRRNRRGSLIAPEDPGQQLSRDEFQELVADLDVEGEPKAGAAGPSATAAPRRHAAPPPPKTKPRLRGRGPATEAPDERQPSATRRPTSRRRTWCSRKTPKPRPKTRRPRNRSHGRSR